MKIKIIGAGLAGCEAAWQCARRGVPVELYEMRPVKSTPAHQTDKFAELVCSNSLKSESENTAPWLLKEEMRRAGSLLIRIAQQTSVPAGHALAVDREAFAAEVTQSTSVEPLITVRREEVTRIDETEGLTVIATGPLTSDALSKEVARLSGSDHLFFYDSISPIVEADSIDQSRVYFAARYGKGTADYINCPFSKDEYDRFYDALIAAQSVEGHDWEKLNYFEGCLPIEEIARRGRDTLRFGPMKPVGLDDPRTGKWPYAAVQLRKENLRADSYNIVGFQNHLKFGEQARVLRLIPGLENAKFLRYGQIHRNTYINAPSLLTPLMNLKQHPNVFFAGQISGVEGYTESIAMGMLVGMNVARIAQGLTAVPPPRETALGSLVHYLCNAESKSFQPANITFDLLPQLDEATRRGVRDKKLRHKMVCEQAISASRLWLEQVGSFNSAMPIQTVAP
ncbi:MAG TPA: methylenetetrahydrofolate--tRNA-(uracil(54)-C(5))-methyltransferase (FADH(2)-oxidizing) TrmFO [Candidatus Angelobacter sp.]|jgi:methylenetetrahydrofolate--tRNA-(uracil-5-)-methyltransferase|nr:methylenetetrahydrofolate--tRNA-(uracil(54)-C(5))-methyltransferase (FADH(2)-oxidizing) TrmFO [Candidatus Angelobacter sp.]